ncbi:MAG: SEC-C metal-binding domain-containing protein [Gemmatimonadota bacterium]
MPVKVEEARFRFAEMELQADVESALVAMAELNQNEIASLTNFFQMPEPGVSLTRGSKPRSVTREFSYLNQMCHFHVLNFKQMSRVRRAYLVDSYLSSCIEGNPFGIVNAARSLLEAHAMTAYVASQLADASAGDESDWATRGARFFSVMVQARFGTTDPAKRDLMETGTSIAAEHTKPVRINSAWKHLAKTVHWIEPHYAALSDGVHPNLSSQRLAGLGAGLGTVARSAAGGEIRLKDDYPILHYEFGRAELGRSAIERTAVYTALNSRGILEEASLMLESPFSDAEIARNRAQHKLLGFASSAQRARTPSRNALCPCGSGRVYKRCCADN